MSRQDDGVNDDDGDDDDDAGVDDDDADDDDDDDGDDGDDELVMMMPEREGGCQGVVWWAAIKPSLFALPPFVKISSCNSFLLLSIQQVDCTFFSLLCPLDI